MSRKKLLASADELRKHYENGLSQGEIAEMYGVHQHTVWAAFKRFGLRSHQQGRTARPWQQRFWKYVDRSGPIPQLCSELGPCWLWMASKHENGYGLLVRERSTKQYRGKQKTAHRLSWELHNGSVPEGLSVLHRCDNPPCVNPQHLFLGTQTDNMRDMFAKGRNKIGIHA